MCGNRHVALGTFRSLLLVTLLAVWQFGCGDSRVPPSGGNPPPTGSAPPPENISVSPASAAVGSPDLTLTVTATQHFLFTSADHKFNQVVWTANSSETALATTFVSSSQLTAVVPAPLLENPLQAGVRVDVWDIMGDVPDATSSSVPFSVTTASAASPSITSISPSSAGAGSSQVTITITGSNFENQFFHASVAFWTTDPKNLHDHGKMLHTTFVSSTELTAVIPAALLQSPASVQVLVLNADPFGLSDGYFGYPKSNPVTFTVTP